MDGSPLHSALREIRQHFSDLRVLGGMAIVSLLLGFSGPFGTFAALETPERLLYWTVTLVATYGTGSVIGRIVRHTVRDRALQPALQVLIAGLVAGVPATTAVVLVNLATFGLDVGWRIIDLFSLWLNVTLITMGVMIISILVDRSASDPAAISPDTTPVLLDRVPLPQRGPLLSLSVADHYVEVTTAKGRALLLMRLSDAIKETRPTAGLQIHRSHWVALDAVARTLRIGGKLMVELRDGRRLPVSRSYARDIRDAGLIV